MAHHCIVALAALNGFKGILKREKAEGCDLFAKQGVNGSLAVRARLSLVRNLTKRERMREREREREMGVIVATIVFSSSAVSALRLFGLRVVGAWRRRLGTSIQREREAGTREKYVAGLSKSELQQDLELLHHPLKFSTDRSDRVYRLHTQPLCPLHSAFNPF